MDTMARITSVEKKGPPSWAFGFPGGKVAGTTDPEIGQPLLEAFERDPEHCLVELQLEKRGERLWITAGRYIEAPEELGGPAEDPSQDASGDTAAPDSESAVPPQELPEPKLVDTISLDDLLQLADRVAKMEAFLATKGYEK